MIGTCYLGRCKRLPNRTASANKIIKKKTKSTRKSLIPLSPLAREIHEMAPLVRECHGVEVEENEKRMMRFFFLAEDSAGI